MKKAETMTAVVEGYEAWIRSIKERIQRARVKASMLVNSEQTLLYWDIGHEILEKQENEGWGSKVVERMSADLKAAFPDMKGWSRSNLMYMRQFADAWTRKEIVQAPLGQLPWYHHLALLECVKSRGDRIAYAALATSWPSTRLPTWTDRSAYPHIASVCRRWNNFRRSCGSFSRKGRKAARNEFYRSGRGPPGLRRREDGGGDHSRPSRFNPQGDA